MRRSFRSIMMMLGASALAALGGVATATPVGAVGAVGASCLPGFTDAGGGWCQRDFAYTGAPQTVTLPSAGWYQVNVDARGAQGGMSREDGDGQGSNGGLGGRQTGTVLRPGGSTLTLVVGQEGSTQANGLPVPGGYGGGGAAASVYGGGGGGGSYVFDAAGPVVIAGGGGGGGFDANPTWCGPTVAINQESPGGAGSGAVGPGGDGHSVAFACDPTFGGPTHYPPGGGKGATSSGPGAGGVPGTPPNNLFGQMPGDPGQGPAFAPYALGLGGNGGGSNGGSGCFSTWSGGGGGGLYGGGGGGDIPCDLEGGGGGGAVGYVDLHATGLTSQTGVQPGNGQITLRYAVGSAPAWPVVTANPTDQVVDAGTAFSFSATASGTPAPTVRWQKSIDGGSTFADVAGATSATYSAAATTIDDGSLYRAVFTNTTGTATTSAALLTVNPPATSPPTVVDQPLDTNAVVGGTYSFTASATGTPVPTVQWQESTDGGATFADVPGATSSTLTGTATLADSGAHFRAVFANDGGTAITNDAVLTVTSTTAVTITPSVVAPVSGQRVRLTIGVQSPVTGKKKVVAGTVDLYVDGASLASGLPVKSGKVVWSGALLAGVHSLRADYSGAGAVLPATSGTTPYTVTSMLTTTGLTGPKAGKAGVKRTYHVAVRDVAPGKGFATGTVAVYDGESLLGTVTLDAKGHGALLLPTGLTSGTHALTAVYGGDSEHNGSNSAIVLVVVA